MTMKKSIATLATLLMLSLICLPKLVRANWPLTLHDDGGPYRALALDTADGITVAAVVTPSTIELTAAAADGTRIGWSTIELPDALQPLPRRSAWVQLKRGAAYVTVVGGGSSYLTHGLRYRVPLQQRRGRVTFGQASGSSLAMPLGARDVAASIDGNVATVAWLTQDDEGIAAVHLTRIP